jgi:ABC transporter substrate binding protein
MAAGSPGTRAAQQATTTIPIIMVSVGDPVGVGFIASLARPGGNITGSTVLAPELAPKRLQLLKEVIPTLANPADPAHVPYFELVCLATAESLLKILRVLELVVQVIFHDLLSVRNELLAQRRRNVESFLAPNDLHCALCHVSKPE